MQCPKCQSSHKKKNGFRRGKQSYKCKDCGYQFVENPISRKYPPEVKQICLKMYLNGLGFRAISKRSASRRALIRLLNRFGRLLSAGRVFGM